MNWIELLRGEVARTSKTHAAARIGVSRTAVSLALSGKYPAATDRLEAKVMAVLGRVACPFLETEIESQACRHYRERPVPTSNPLALRHWRVCQQCNVGRTCRDTQ